MRSEQRLPKQVKRSITASINKTSAGKGYINRKVIMDMHEYLKISQCFGVGRFRNPRLFNRVVVVYNRHVPGFAEWLCAAGYLKNMHTPGKKLTLSHRVYQEADGRYYCFPATQFYLFLLMNLYRDQTEEAGKTRNNETN